MTHQEHSSVFGRALPSNDQARAFADLGISPKLLQSLSRLGFREPTPIQAKTIPIAVEGKDIVGIAQTGTGKTMAFGLPMIQRIGRGAGKGLIVLPTRELAIQVDEALRSVAAPLGLKTVVIIGGEAMGKQLAGIRRRPHIIIGTPGRLNDHLQQRTLNLSEIGILVLDEADRMLDMGFAPQISQLVSSIPKDRQTMLFSATMPHGIVKLASQYMKLPVRVEIAPPGTAAEKVEHEVFFVDKPAKLRLLQKILTDYHGTALVFCRTKHGAKKVAYVINGQGHRTAELHSNRSLNQRREAMAGFKSGKYRVLVATDIAARGIDVADIELVINFDLPSTPDDYVHRIGRTGRAGRTGKAISFAEPNQRRDVRDIERLMRAQLPVSPLPELPPGVHVPQGAPRPYDSVLGSHSSGRRSPGGHRSFGQRPGQGGGRRFGGGGGSFGGQRRGGPGGGNRRRFGGGRPR